MGLAKKRLGKERSIHFSNLITGALLTGVGAFGSVMVFLNGMGTNTGRSRGLGAMLYKGIDLLVEKGILTLRWVSILMSVLFLGIALYGLRVLWRSLRGMSAKHTAFGKSLLTQMRPGETLKGLIAEIDEDMGREHISYGPIHIGSRWILGDEAMRLSDIVEIYTLNGGRHGVALALVDKNRTTQFIGLDVSKGEKIEEAAMSLHALCPGAKMGEGKEYLDMTEPGWDREEAPAITIAAGALQTAGGLTLSGKGCVPTSNFDRELLSGALKEVEAGEELCITLLEPTKPDKYTEVEALLGRRKDEREWELVVAYTEYSDEPGEARYPTDYYGVLDAMTLLTEQKKLPDFSDWEQHNLLAEAKKRAKQEKKAQKKQVT